jgi:hypothetical protein
MTLPDAINYIQKMAQQGWARFFTTDGEGPARSMRSLVR